MGIPSNKYQEICKENEMLHKMRFYHQIHLTNTKIIAHVELKLSNWQKLCYFDELDFLNMFYVGFFLQPLSVHRNIFSLFFYMSESAHNLSIQ